MKEALDQLTRDLKESQWWCENRAQTVEPETVGKAPGVPESGSKHRGLHRRRVLANINHHRPPAPIFAREPIPTVPDPNFRPDPSPGGPCRGEMMDAPRSRLCAKFWAIPQIGLQLLAS